MPQANGRSRRSASRSTSRSSPSVICTPERSFSFTTRRACGVSKSFGGTKLQEPCVTWYLSPFACLYDLLQFAFGQRNGLERRSDESGRERVVLARVVEVGEGEVEDDAEAEVDACADSGWY